MNDAIGAPEFFIDHIRLECAGTGLIRIFGIAVRDGNREVLYSAVMPADALRLAAGKCLIAAEKSMAAAVGNQKGDGRSH